MERVERKGDLARMVLLEQVETRENQEIWDLRDLWDFKVHPVQLVPQGHREHRAQEVHEECQDQQVLLVFRGSPVNLAVQVRRVNRELSVVVVRGDKGETEERLEEMGWMDQLGLLALQEGVENQEQRESGEIKEDLVPPGLRAVEASVVRPVPTEFREHPGNEERVEMTG